MSDRSTHPSEDQPAQTPDTPAPPPFPDQRPAPHGASQPERKPEPNIEPAPAWTEDPADPSNLLAQLEDDGPKDAIDLSDRRPVPSVAIQAFVESPQTAEAFEAARSDRRLARATITVAEGGILEATHSLADTPSGEVVIVETSAGRDLLLAQMDTLAEVCEVGTHVIVIGTVNDAGLVRDLRRRGVEDYLLSPANPVTLIDALTGLYERKGDEAGGKVIAFMSARGGAGSSTIAHGVAWYLAQTLGEETLLADLDLSFGTAALDFDQEAGQTIADVLAAQSRLDLQLLNRIKIQIGDRLSLLAAPESLDAQDLGGDAWDPLIACARAASSVTVLDMPSTWTPWSGPVLMAADQIVIVMTPDLASVRNARLLLGTLRRRRPHDPPPVLLLNQTGMPNRQEVTVQALEETLATTPFASLPFDPALFGKAANSGQTIFEENADAPASKQCAALARHVAGHAEKQRGGEAAKGALAKLMSMVKRTRPKAA